MERRVSSSRSSRCTVRRKGVTTEGLAYPLRGETLEAGSSRGVSNVFVEETARISVERGVLLAIRPGAAA